jgi:hypothetical protein
VLAAQARVRCLAPSHTHYRLPEIRKCPPPDTCPFIRLEQCSTVLRQANKRTFFAQRMGEAQRMENSLKNEVSEIGRAQRLANHAKNAVHNTNQTKHFAVLKQSNTPDTFHQKTGDDQKTGEFAQKRGSNKRGPKRLENYAKNAVSQTLNADATLSPQNPQHCIRNSQLPLALHQFGRQDPNRNVWQSEAKCCIACKGDTECPPI